jgi:hypothetical protein
MNLFVMPLRILLTIILGLLPFVASAQNKQEKRTCRILFLAPQSGAPQTLHLFDGTTVQEVELGRMSFSPVYELTPGDIKIALMDALPKPGVGNRPPAVPDGAPQVAIRESIKDFYLILSSDPENKVAPVRMQVVNANAEGFKNGQMMWYNLTDSLVGGIVGSQKLRIKPNSREILDAPASGDTDYHVNIHYVPVGKQHTEPVCETRWIHDPRSRGVFFILKEHGSIAPRIIGIPDFREEKTRQP